MALCHFLFLSLTLYFILFSPLSLISLKFSKAHPPPPSILFTTRDAQTKNLRTQTIQTIFEPNSTWGGSRRYTPKVLILNEWVGGEQHEICQKAFKMSGMSFAV